MWQALSKELLWSLETKRGKALNLPSLVLGLVNMELLVTCVDDITNVIE